MLEHLHGTPNPVLKLTFRMPPINFVGLFFGPTPADHPKQRLLYPNDTWVPLISLPPYPQAIAEWVGNTGRARRARWRYGGGDLAGHESAVRGGGPARNRGDVAGARESKLARQRGDVGVGQDLGGHPPRCGEGGGTPAGDKADRAVVDWCIGSREGGGGQAPRAPSSPASHRRRALARSGWSGRSGREAACTA